MWREVGDIVPRLHPNYLILPETARNPGYSASSNVGGCAAFEQLRAHPYASRARRDGAIPPSFFPTPIHHLPVVPRLASREKDGVVGRRKGWGTGGGIAFINLCRKKEDLFWEVATYP